jgi:hypothetical protein
MFYFMLEFHRNELLHNYRYLKNFVLRENFPSSDLIFHLRNYTIYSPNPSYRKIPHLESKILFYRKRCLHNSQFGFQYKKVLLLTKKFAKTNICITLRFNLHKDFSMQTNSQSTNPPHIQENQVRATRQKNPSEKG